MRIPAEPKVIIRHCDEYDAARIRVIAREALEALELAPFGRTLVKPNLVAAGPQFPFAHTRPEVTEGMLRALRDVGNDQMQELAVGERCGITVPTRVTFAESGFDAMLERVPGVKRYCFEEQQQLEIAYTHPERLRDYVFTPAPVAQADFFVNMPKFKAHPWTTVTFSMKNYIGIQDDRHRLIDHDHRLDDKIADLQHIIQPQLICIDGIIAGEGRMLTPKPRRLNLLVFGNSQVAFDAVCCHIIGVDPRSVGHIRLAEDRGFGTTDLSKIQLSGDVSLEEAKSRAEGFEVGLIRVEKYFEGTNITAYAGPPPEREHAEYCWGGCPGAIEEAIEILRQFDEQCDEKLPRMHVVFGDYQGPIDAQPGERVFFIGDCARWQGEIHGKPVQVESVYQHRDSKDPYTIKHDDVYAKLVSTIGKLQVRRVRDEPYMRLTGCPVSVAEQVMLLASVGAVKNPIFEPRNALSFNRGYLGWRLATAAKRLRGEAYQVKGPCQRGEAAPDVRDKTGS
ncbi:MAG: DUF362 domain-containing protein [Myxococcales bacterium]|nr:DUF362 domain-containing protein [Myxococcales bacterium]